MTAPLSGGEVDFLWWFIQGSIMDANVRAQLRGGTRLVAGAEAEDDLAPLARLGVENVGGDA